MKMEHIVISVKDFDDRVIEEFSGSNEIVSAIGGYEYELGSGISMAPNRAENRDKLLLGATWSHEILEVNLKFEGRVEASCTTLSKYTIQTDFNFKYKKNDNDRVLVVCSLVDKMGCQWRI